MNNIALLLISLVMWFNKSFTQELYPVVLKGNQVPCIIGKSPQNIVGFVYKTGAWQQIPIQIDEMEVNDITSPYGPFASTYYSVPTGVNELFYSDENTFIGKDSTDFNFDNDDELVIMWSDLADKANATTNPNGTLNTLCCEIKIANPLNNNDSAFLYLFENNGSLNQDAGVSYVSYNFNLTAGTYPTNYNITSGPNPETSTLITNTYQVNMIDRWVNEELYIKKNTSNPNIFNGHQNFFAPGSCGRSEYTFAIGEGAFATNKNGPIRAIRSYMGANSGPLTQRTHLFYAKKQTIITDLRVHSIPSIYDVFDYSSNAYGMMNVNNLNTTALTIDGNTDVYNSSGQLEWELVSGNLGSIIISHKLEGTFTPGTDGTVSYYWEDNVSSPVSNCTGDNLPIGTSGPSISIGGICTDPVSSCNPGNYRSLKAIRDVYYDTSVISVNEAKTIDSTSKTPFLVSITSCNFNTTNIKASNIDNIRVFPNPTQNSFTIEGIKLEDVKIINVQGKVIQHISKPLSNTVNLNNEPGIYMIKLNNQYIVKIVKE